MAIGADRVYYSGSGGIGAVTYGGTAQSGVSVSDGAVPQGMTEGINGAIYYAEAGKHLNEFEPSGTSQGTITSWNDFEVTSYGTNSVVSDPNGNLWFAEDNNSAVIEMSPWGSLLARTALSSGGQPWHLAIGADAASIWVTERTANKIAKLNLSGSLLAEYNLPATNCGSSPNDITLGGDGNMYFTEDVGTGVQGYIGQVTSSGTISCVVNPNTGNSTGIAEGPDGNIWIAEHEADAIVKFNLSTQTFGTPFSTASEGGNPEVMALGADGQLWFITSNDKMTSFKPN